MVDVMIETALVMCVLSIFGNIGGAMIGLGVGFKNKKTLAKGVCCFALVCVCAVLWVIRVAAE